MTAMALSGCASNGSPEMPDISAGGVVQAQTWDGAVSLAQIQNLEASGNLQALTQEAAKTGEGSRFMAMKEAAFALGVQAGLYERAREINGMLSKAMPQLNKLFDFAPYMLPGNVFPPVITETKGMVEKENRSKVRKVRHSYHIVTLPALMIEPPTFINYLVRHYPMPEMPSKFIQPSTSVEKKNWAVWVTEGWHIGRQQADLQYQADSYRLQRDLQGVRLFHDLVGKGMISMPKLTKQEFGLVKSGDGRTLNIGDEVTQILKDSTFENSDKWVPVIRERIDG